MKYAPAVRTWFRQYASLDLRALALTRILLASIVLCDLFYRAHHLYEHYGRFGIFPQELWHIWWAQNGYWSLHMLFGAPGWSLALILLEALAAFLMLLGWHTRLSTVVVCFLAVSLNHANPFILQGGDIWLTTLLFLGIFLPLGEYASVDAGLQESHQENFSFVNIWTFAYILQIALFYFAAGLFKSGSTWQNGTAVYFALSLEYFRTPFGSLLYQFPSLLKTLTFGVHYLQYSAPYLILAPFFTKYLRTTAVVLLIGMHTGLGLSMHLGPFSFVSIAGLCALLPSSFFASASLFLQKYFGTITIYYDEGCGFCKKSSNLIRTLLLLTGSRVVPAQSDPSIYADMKLHNSWVIVDASGKRFFTYKAGVRIIETSPLLFFTTPLWKLRISNTIGEKTYRYISNHRGGTCKLPQQNKNTKTLKTLAMHGSFLCGIAYMGTVTIANIAPFVNQKEIYKANNAITAPSVALGITQNWRMFAPDPPSVDGWIIARGIFSNGREYDLFPYLHPLSYQKPTHVALPPYIPDERVRKYLGNVLGNTSALTHIHFYAEYLCRVYTKPGLALTQAPLVSIEIYSMKQIVELTRRSNPEKSLLYTMRCADLKDK